MLQANYPMDDHVERPVSLALRARGSLGFFPDGVGAPMSTPWPAPPVARALLESVLWKPRMRWVVREIWLLAPVRYARRPCPEDAPPLGLRADEPLVVLQDVDLLVRADLYLNAAVPRRDAADNHGKYAAMFQRRLARGQAHTAAYFGLRAYPAELLPVTGEERPVPLDLDWGPMRGDWDRPEFEARAVGGVVRLMSSG